MANCERVLHKHTECVKGFLRDARSNDLIYAPGTYGDHDRCADTRQSYVDCRHGPKAKVEKQVIDMASSQAQPLDFYKQRSVSGYRVKEETQHGALPTLLGSKGPPACEMELNMHGKCVENYFRSAMTKGTDYIWLSHDGEDKCFNTRASFEKCLTGNRAIAEGKRIDNQKAEPWESRTTAKHFSVVGHW